MGRRAVLTEAEVTARVRHVCTALGYAESSGWEFERQPSSHADGTFTVRYTSAAPNGGMAFTEEARGTVLVSVLRMIRDHYTGAHVSVLSDLRDILGAVIRDGADVSGEYAVEDGGRTITVEAPRGANYLVGRMAIPVNFEAQF